MKISAAYVINSYQWHRARCYEGLDLICPTTMLKKCVADHGLIESNLSVCSLKNVCPRTIKENVNSNGNLY